MRYLFFCVGGVGGGIGVCYKELMRLNIASDNPTEKPKRVGGMGEAITYAYIYIYIYIYVLYKQATGNRSW